MAVWHSGQCVSDILDYYVNFIKTPPPTKKIPKMFVGKIFFVLLQRSIYWRANIALILTMIYNI